MIKKVIKDLVWRRQKGSCAACVSYGNQYYTLNKQYVSCYNTVLLCQTCNKEANNNVEIYQSILEYLYFCKYQELCDNPSRLWGENYDKDM